MTTKQSVRITISATQNITGRAEKVTPSYTMFEFNNQLPRIEDELPDDILIVSRRNVYGAEFILCKIPAARVTLLTENDLDELNDEMFGFLPANERPYGLV